MKAKWVFLAVLLTIFAVPLACTLLGSELQFDVVTVNRDAGPLDDVQMTFKGYNFNVGILREAKSITAGMTYSGYIGKWPQTIEVSWIVEGNPEVVFKRNLRVPKPLRFGKNEYLQLIVEFKNGDITAYPRVVESFEEKGLSYRYQDE